MQSWIKLTLLTLYLIDIANTINASHLDNKKYYAVSKGLLIPLLLTLYLVAIPREVLAKPYQKFMILAYICHCQGDILLLLPKEKTKIYFYIGTLSFFAGHIFNIIWFMQPHWSKNSTLTVVSAIVAIIMEILLGIELLSKDKKLGTALLVYSSALGFLGVVIASTKSLAATVGICVFWISDYTIARREMNMKTTSNTTTISTYIVAQSLIVLGMYLMQV